MNQTGLMAARLTSLPDDDPNPGQQLVGRYAQREDVLESACTWERVSLDCPYCHERLRVRSPLLIGRIAHVSAKGVLTIDRTPDDIVVLECRPCGEKFTTFLENLGPHAAAVE